MGGTSTEVLDPEAPATEQQDDQPSTDETSGNASLGTVTEETPREKKHRIRKAAKVTGAALHTAGSAVVDTDLRDIGQATKRFGRKVKSHVRMPVKVVRVHECEDPSCPHTGAAA